jgi:hypothetical protein
MFLAGGEEFVRMQRMAVAVGAYAGRGRADGE